ncbi:MAG: cell division protein FtsH, partial [Dehalococcoidales bacterium]|nr:cell division protein FtsH [Dehalococcoidales bacterium]
MKPSWKRSSLIYLAILLAGIFLLSRLFTTSTEPNEIDISEVIVMSQDGEIEKIVVQGETLLITTINGTELKSFKGDTNIFEIPGLNFEGVEIDIRPGGFNWGSLLIGFLPLLLFGGLLFFLFTRARGANSQAFSFGRSRARLFPASKP